ncbi:hypothetical protein ILUMI_18603 [Ignelater luminosus]|nr:hypothetical protein ILUMI_18603 [Ignelater luminosus]
MRVFHSKLMKKEIHGVYDYQKVMDQNVIFVKWNGNSIVTLGSNISCVYPLHSVKRHSQQKNKFITVDQPHLINLSNGDMGGVDRSDQNIAQYRISIGGKKWS